MVCFNEHLAKCVFVCLFCYKCVYIYNLVGAVAWFLIINLVVWWESNELSEKKLHRSRNSDAKAHIDITLIIFIWKAIFLVICLKNCYSLLLYIRECSSGSSSIITATTTSFETSSNHKMFLTLFSQWFTSQAIWRNASISIK